MPNNITNKYIVSEKLQRFLIIKENWSPDQITSQRSTKIAVPTINKEVSLIELKRCNEQTAMFKRIKQYLDELEYWLNNSKEVDFSAYFFEVMEKEQGNVNVSTRFASRAMEKYFKSQIYQVEIQKDRISYLSYPTTVKLIVKWRI